MYKINELLSFYDQVIGMRVPCYNQMLGVMTDFVPDKSHILDLGIFSGNFEQALCLQGKSFSYVGVDIVESKDFVGAKLQKAGFKEWSCSITIKRDLRKFTFPLTFRNHFNVASSNLVMHSLKNKKAVFQNIHCCLEDGGVFLLGDKFLVEGDLARICSKKSQEWSEKTKKNMDTDDLAKYEAMWKLYPEEREHLLSVGEYCSMLREVGFKEVGVVYQYYQYAVLYVKK